ncbi:MULTISPECIES: MarR family winged helix-turn-helix transcriptional regulator [unclassified Streptomyces]|uniref:MarR family winged helix-turn-helix transcriptional regulator n=1 Tax=unclassified Streptomyces TaxID=2593676 RepID=UPI00143ECE04|nr:MULTISPECIES: MarR family transcriptional regulator [unclassified Streptomyces]QIY66199.1 MarR family transcriptional regulator [Streptomyces sp. RPA4-2]
MTERIRPNHDHLRDAARQARCIAELFDVMWEQDRNEGPPPYISVSQLRVMNIVDREDGIRMRALTRLLGAARPSVCRLVDRLQALGFVERRPWPDSGREVLLTLTPSGRRHLDQLRGRREELLMEALATMPAHQRTAMAEGIARLQSALVDLPMLRLAPEDAPLISVAQGQARSA